MKLYLLLLFSFVFVYSSTDVNAQQVFWTETFGSGCNTGTEANNENTANGTWTVSNTGVNGTDANIWYISAEENGEGVGNCGAGCGNNPTLHISPTTIDVGAAYLNGDGGFGFDATTDARAQSPLIDCTGECDITLSFEYIENGDGTLDNHILWYFDGTTWSVLDDTPKTPTTCSPQGEWSQYSIGLPSSADNNPDVKIGFQWVNNNDNTGTDPSFAVYNIELSSNDTQAPTLACDSDFNVYFDSIDCESVIPELDTTGIINPTDNCTSVSDLLISQDIAPGTLIAGHLSQQDVTVTVEDLAGNSNTCIITVRALDTIAPSIDCAISETIFADADCEGALDDYTSAVNILDNCSSLGDILVQQSPASGTVIQNDETVLITATDEVGNDRTCAFTVVFSDTVSPTVVCPTTQTQSTQPGSCDTLIQDYTDQIIWDDNCTSSALDMTFSQSITPGDLVSGGVNTITITATDDSGNTGTCNFQLEVIDVEDPSITCPSNQQQFANSACNITLDDYTNDAVVSDNCSTLGNINITQTPTIGTVISGAGSVQLVTLTAEDEAGNTASCDFEVTVVDTISPVPSCPADDTVSVTAGGCVYELTDIAGSVGASDNCSSFGDLIITQDIPVGTNLSAGSHEVIIDATDESGNTGSCIFKLEVEDLEDPVIVNCAPDTSVVANADCEGVLGDYTDILDLTDNCDAFNDLVVTQNPAIGSPISSTTTVILTVTDLSGNTSNCSIEVEIADTEDPDIVCPTEFIVSVDSNCDFDAPDLSSEISGTDNCSTFSNMTISQDPAPMTALNGATQVEVFLTDESGNEASCLISVIPDDIVPPTIDCPADQVENIGTACDLAIADYTGLAVVSDNCPDVTINQTPSVGTLVETGTTAVTLTATDVSGNLASCSFNLFVEENVDPEITCPDPVSTCDPLVTYADPVGSDNCGGFEISQTDVTGFTSGDEFPVGITTQTYEIVDSSGNTNSCSFDIEILESPSAAEIITDDISLCDTLSVFLEAEPATSGTGSWTVETGTGTLNNEFANNTGANNLSFGSNIFVWEIETASCGSSSDTVSVTVFEQPVPASNSDTLYLCNDTALNVSGNTPNVGSGLWYATDNDISFLDENSPNTLASDFSGGWNDLIWQISNGTCPVSRDTMRVYFHEKPSIITNDTTICIDDNKLFLDAGENLTGVNSGWYFIEGSGTIETPSSAQTNVSELEADNNTIVYARVHPICQNKFDTVNVFVDLCGGYEPTIPTVITPNNDGKNDLFVVENLNTLYPEAVVVIVNRWGNMVFESEGYEEPWNGTKFNSGEELPLGTYFYRINLNDGSGDELTGPISIIR